MRSTLKKKKQRLRKNVPRRIAATELLRDRGGTEASSLQSEGWELEYAAEIVRWDEIEKSSLSLAQ